MDRYRNKTYNVVKTSILDFLELERFYLYGKPTQSVRHSFLYFLNIFFIQSYTGTIGHQVYLFSSQI